ncbi:RNA polymerase sigma factor [Rhizobium sp. P32RR-XVIII]|uniref:RNA polymerase sigma factor n=1 Tax=Rhizobium sp. P32RR-XVIII TaxID=2726738 RepID=UPI0014572EB7|nr:RNA polymerase sigma factor [Rhizobium sp. P32RR-XVIII]NLS08003.1 RNA polymerase sigma factor [Rhizobium sp. P32RR-XVIII]
MKAQSIITNEHDFRHELVAYLGRLWRYGLVLSRRRDVAEDLVQATCLRALERGKQYRPGTRLDCWLLSILHSIWLNEVRSRRVQMGQGFVAASSSLVLDGENDIETRALANQILLKVDALPEAQRTVVFLAYIEGFSYREVAELLGIPIGTVMNRLASARVRLASEECSNTAMRVGTGGRDI